MSKILLTFATEKEAKVTLQQLDAKVIQSSGFYSFARGYIVITGLGILAAAVAVMRHVKEVDEVWNFGIAGSLRETHAIGFLHPVQTVSKFISYPQNIDKHSQNLAEHHSPDLALHCDRGSRLVSSDFPIHNYDIKKHLANDFEAVDMEGYGIAFATLQAGKPCKIWKAISDYSSPEGQKLIQDHIEALSYQMADAITQELGS